MFNSIKTYFKTKKLKREMKFQLLSLAYLFTANISKYIGLLDILADIAATEDKADIINKMIDAVAKYAHETNSSNKE